MQLDRIAATLNGDAASDDLSPRATPSAAVARALVRSNSLATAGLRTARLECPADRKADADVILSDASDLRLAVEHVVNADHGEEIPEELAFQPRVGVRSHSSEAIQLGKHQQRQIQRGSGIVVPVHRRGDVYNGVDVVEGAAIDQLFAAQGGAERHERFASIRPLQVPAGCKRRRGAERQAQVDVASHEDEGADNPAVWAKVHVPGSKREL